MFCWRIKINNYSFLIFYAVSAKSAKSSLKSSRDVNSVEVTGIYKHRQINWIEAKRNMYRKIEKFNG
jgi:hypothetical protein